MPDRKYRKQEVPELYRQRLSFIGGLLKEYRWESGLSRYEVEKEFGIHHRTIQEIERGNNISLVTLFRYLDCFDLEVPDIAFTDEEIL
jgi:transcriptional regulator with XRE-family HTH domain